VVDVHKFAVRVDPGDSVDWPNVTVLIDGEDLIGRHTGFKGFDPGLLFSTEALLPQHPSRRVAIYCCSCGEPGCGCAACVISERERTVWWRDFLDFTGVYGSPTVNEEPTGGRALPVPDLAFDASQYYEAVHRAGNDRSWETQRRRLARLLRGSVVRHATHFADRGYSVGWVSPAWDLPNGIDVELRIPNGQIVVRVEADLELPDDVAVERMKSALLGKEDFW